MANGNLSNPPPVFWYILLVIIAIGIGVGAYYYSKKDDKTITIKLQIPSLERKD